MPRSACRAGHRSPLLSLVHPGIAAVIVAGGLMAATVTAATEHAAPRPEPRPAITVAVSPATAPSAEAARPSRIALPPRPTPRPLHASGRLAPADAAWRTTLAFAEAGKWPAALAVAGRSNDPHLGAVLLWLSLQDKTRQTDFATVADFLTQHPGWPGEPQLELLAESLMPANLPASARVMWFKAHRPRTGDARLAYLAALERVGPDSELSEEARGIWREVELSEKTQKEFLSRYGRHLRPADHEARLDELLWRGQADAAARMLPLVSADWRKLADARLRLRKAGAGVDAAIEAVPKSLREHPGLLYERIRWRRERGQVMGARELLFEAPPKAEFEALWWRERSWHIREAMDRGNMQDAYLLAASHIQRGGVAFADAEWLAGWIALRFLERPADALPHFRILYENVTMPISRGRAAYWAGRAADALGDDVEARQWYARGAEHATTFYGQLASARLGATRVVLPKTPPIPPQRVEAFNQRDMVRATRALIRVDRRELAERFLRTMAFRAADEDESFLVAQLAARNGFTSTAVYATRRATRSNADLVDIGYPLLDPIPTYAPDPALVHAIIRQESGFDREAISRAGARGLMQLMPATAKETSRRVGIDYDLGALLTDPEYNVTLGRAYLAAMVERFGGHYVLAIAAYNAGPSLVSQWIARNGHPAAPDVDVIDWI